MASIAAPCRPTKLSAFRAALTEVKMPEERRNGVDTATEIIRLLYMSNPSMKAADRMAKIRELANSIIEMTHSVDARITAHI
jgi:hypothetical protein